MLPASRFGLAIFLSLAFHFAYARLGMRADSLTESTFKAFVDSSKGVLIDFYDSKDPSWRDGESELQTAVRNVRSMGSKVPFAKVDVSKETSLAAKYVPEGRYPQLMWFLHGEATQYHRTLRTAKAIGDFVIALDRDAMVKVKSEEEAHDFVPAVFAHVGKDTPAFRTLEVVAQKHMDTVAFTFLEGSGNEISWFGAAGDQPLKYDGALDVAAIEKWVQQRLLKSEDAPKGDAQEDEGSRVVVGKTFEDIVLQKDKDVILQVYAPWCGFCKKFSSVWNSFAQEVKDVPHLVVAKMDGSRNGSPVPEFAWDAYPKIFYVRAGEKTPVHFTGDRSLTNLLDFIGKHSTKPLNLGSKPDSQSGSADAVLDL